MNIVQLLSQVELTGAEVHGISLAEALTKKGHQCFIISDELHLKTDVPFTALAVHRAKHLSKITSIVKLRQFIKQHQIQIIHAHSRAAVRLGFWATLGTKCALVTTLHGRQHYSYSKKLFNLYGEKIIAVCENIKLQMQNDFNLKPSQINVIRNFFNFERIQNQEAINSTRNVTNAGSGKTLVSFLGRTSGPKGKNWEFLIENYCETFLTKNPSLEIHFAGGPLESLSSNTQSLIAKFHQKFQSRFYFHGQTESLLPLITKSHLVVAAGRIAIEALLLKKKVFALGEQSYEGLVSPETLAKNKASNFGDILISETTEINWTKLAEDLQTEISKQDSNNTVTSFDLDYLQQDYSEPLAVERIISTYESALFKKQYPKNIPILMYHQVVEKEIQSPHKIYITAENFEKHLVYLTDAGFKSLTFEDLYQFKIGKKSLSTFPKKPIILTFDDGYENNLTLAIPLLKKYNLKAVFYLLANIHETNSWDKNSGAPCLPLMTKEQRQILAKDMEIGSHGFDHKKLSQMTDTEAFAEIKNSKVSLEKEFSRPIYSYAYTYGDRHPNSSLYSELAGYKYAVNTTTGGFHHEEDPFSLFRVSIFPTDNPSSLKRKTKSWYRRYYYLKRKE